MQQGGDARATRASKEMVKGEMELPQCDGGARCYVFPTPRARLARGPGSWGLHNRYVQLKLVFAPYSVPFGDRPFSRLRRYAVAVDHGDEQPEHDDDHDAGDDPFRQTVVGRIFRFHRRRCCCCCGIAPLANLQTRAGAREAGRCSTA